MGGESNSISTLPLENFRLLKKIQKKNPLAVSALQVHPTTPAPHVGQWLQPWAATQHQPGGLLSTMNPREPSGLG